MYPAETFLVPSVFPKKPFCIISLSISFSIQIWQLSIQKWYVKIQKSVSFEGFFSLIWCLQQSCRYGWGLHWKKLIHGKKNFPDFLIHFLSLKIDLQKNTIFNFFYFLICFRGYQMPTFQKIPEWAKNLWPSYDFLKKVLFFQKI